MLIFKSEGLRVRALKQPVTEDPTWSCCSFWLHWTSVSCNTWRGCTLSLVLNRGTFNTPLQVALGGSAITGGEVGRGGQLSKKRYCVDVL